MFREEGFLIGKRRNRAQAVPGKFRLTQWLSPLCRQPASLPAIAPRQRFHFFLRILIGSVWVFHGLYSKLLDGIPRHRMIVARVLGEDLAKIATFAVGIGEILLGLWVFSHRFPRTCASAQTLAIVVMNTLEISRAPDLLISAPGMVVLNAAFLALGWYSATRPPLQRSHPA